MGVVLLPSHAALVRCTRTAAVEEESVRVAADIELVRKVSGLDGKWIRPEVAAKRIGRTKAEKLVNQ